MSDSETSLDAIPAATRNIGAEDEAALETGQWYWTKIRDWNSAAQEHRVTERLGCVVHVGSNYAELKLVDGGNVRVGFSTFDAICRSEPLSSQVFKREIDRHRENVRQLMDEVVRVTAQLGIVPRKQVAAYDSSAGTSALAVAHGIADVQAHKAALIKAKEETLPGLFAKVKAENEVMAVWMKAELIPLEAQLSGMQDVTSVIEDRIFTVELYAGLIEELVQVAEGEPAHNDEKVRVFQRRHYMDEECLANYEAGGGKFADLGAFDRWLMKPENLQRILPFSRCVAAFRVRRADRREEFQGVEDFIRFILSGEKDLDKTTFLYVRNGQQLFRLRTGIDFDEQLFPDKDESVLLSSENGKLWVYEEHVISQREYDALGDKQRARQAKYEQELVEYQQKRDEHAAALWQWKKMPETTEEERDDKDEAKPRGPGQSPWSPHCSMHADPDNYTELDPEHLYYDDAIESIAKEASKHNRIATVLQGLLDRSPAFHPHPPWKIFTPEGFRLGVELVYDDSKALTSGDLPDFETYRKQLNRSLKPGSITVGQQDAWERKEAVKYNASLRVKRNYSRYDLRERYRPTGNPGPGRFAVVSRITRTGACEYEWNRTRKRSDSWHEAEEPIRTVVAVPSSMVLNVTAYTPGDYKLFYADPRTRADYAKWAPFLLAAEDYAAGKVKRVDIEDDASEEENNGESTD